MNKKMFLFGKRFVHLGTNKRGQVWVETVIYTLIAFSLMGLVLAFVIPKINETRDKGVIEQSISVLQDVDSLIRNLGGPGNQRVPQIKINKGTMTIDAINNKIFFQLQSTYQYSQPGENVSIGKIIVNTQGQGKINIVTLTLDYTGEYDLNYMWTKDVKTISQAPTPYNILIADNGADSQRLEIINTEVI
jgi:type II secretory pathway pseudopilin PulG